MPKRTRRKQGETSYKETTFGIIPRSQLIPLEIAGIKRAWDFVLRKHTHGNVVVTPELLKQIHRIGFAWIFPEFGGKFRTINVEVSNHKPPAYYLVHQLMTDFTRDLKERLRHIGTIKNPKYTHRVIELLTWAHHRFLWIHPFQDYNGRIARLLINVILLNLGLPPIELKVETPSGRRRYVRALQAADNENEKLLQKLFRTALEEAVRELPATR